MKEKLKQWGWLAILAALAGLSLLLGRKPSWVKDMEGSIKQRDKDIAQVQKERESVKEQADKIKESVPNFAEVVKEQDEKIAQAGKVEEVDTTIKPITDPNDIADFIKDRAGKRK